LPPSPPPPSLTLTATTATTTPPPRPPPAPGATSAATVATAPCAVDPAAPGAPAATAAPATDQDWLRLFLAGRDAPCPGCGYNLRGLASAHCPECGAPLALRVGLVEPRQGAFLCGAIGLGAGIGFNGLLAGYFAWIKVFHRPWGTPEWNEAVPLLVSLGVMAALLAAWVRTRTWQRRRLGPAAHWSLAAASWAVALASAVWFFARVG
jgi:hypothetical protein